MGIYITEFTGQPSTDKEAVEFCRDAAMKELATEGSPIDDLRKRCTPAQEKSINNFMASFATSVTHAVRIMLTQDAAREFKLPPELREQLGIPEGRPGHEVVGTTLNTLAIIMFNEGARFGAIMAAGWAVAEEAASGNEAEERVKEAGAGGPEDEVQ